MLVNVASNYLIGDVIPSGTEMVILILYLIVTIPVVRGDLRWRLAMTCNSPICLGCLVIRNGLRIKFPNQCQPRE